MDRLAALREMFFLADNLPDQHKAAQRRLRIMKLIAKISDRHMQKAREARRVRRLAGECVPEPF